MCESAASHTALRRFISVRSRCARFAHNSLMRRGLLFKLFNSREKPLGLGAIYRRRFISRPTWTRSRRIPRDSWGATVRPNGSRIFISRDTPVGDHLDAGYVSRAESLFCILRFLRNTKLQVAGI